MDTRIAFPAMVKEYRLAYNLTMEQLAEKIGKTKSTISKWESGTRSPKIQEIEELAVFFNIEPSVMMFGKSSKPSPSPNAKNSSVQAINDTVIQLHPERQENVLGYATEQLEEQLEEQRDREVNEPIALYSVETTTELAAGLGYSYDDNDGKTVLVDEEPPRFDLASIVSGDSMIPDYEDGDIVYLKDTGMSSYSGQVCAVAVNDKSYLKKVYTEDDCLRLVSINPKYDDIIIDFPPAEDTHIKIYAVIGSDKVVQD